jgi:LEA14-like dessication related protein
MTRTPALALAALCAGCVLLTATPPEVEVAAVELRGAALLEQSLGVMLCVTNPNRDTLAFRRIRVALDASGAPLLEGESDAPVVLPPLSSTLVPFTVVSTVRNLGPQLLGVVRTGALDYRLRGSVTLDSAGIAVPFSRSGRLGLLEAGQQLVDASPPGTLRCAMRG